MSEGIAKLHCVNCKRLLATVSLFVEPKVAFHCICTRCAIQATKERFGLVDPNENLPYETC